MKAVYSNENSDFIVRLTLILFTYMKKIFKK